MLVVRCKVCERAPIESAVGIKRMTQLIVQAGAGQRRDYTS